MGGILEYVENNMVVMSLLLAAVLAVIIIWNLYLKEKKRAAKIEESVLGERKFYGVFAEENREFYLCIRKRDLKILYVSPNFDQIAVNGVNSNNSTKYLMVIQRNFVA